MVRAQAFTLKSGDIILQSIPCTLCKAIEDEENSPYSHMGVLINDQGKWNVLEAWSKVQETPLHIFLNRRRKETRSLILRSASLKRFHLFSSKKLIQRFKNNYEGKNYDSEFLWDNRDQRGEKYYCSEFVAKFLEANLPNSIPTKAMHYTQHREFWLKYFHGNPPDGLPGLSPGDFERSPLFKKVGLL